MSARAPPGDVAMEPDPFDDGAAYQLQGEEEDPALQYGTPLPRDRALSVRWLTVALTVVPFTLVSLWVLRYMGQDAGLEVHNYVDHTHAWHSFNWHPLCMVAAFSLLFSNALLTFKTFRCLSWHQRKLLHAALQVTALLIATGGIVAVVQYKQGDNQNQFYTVHSWMGIGTYSLFCIQTVLGLLFLLRPTLFVWLFPAHEPFLRSVLPWHVLAGLGIYLGACISIISGLNTRQWILQLEGLADIYAFQFILANLAACSVLALGWATYYQHKQRSPERALDADSGDFDPTDE